MPESQHAPALPFFQQLSEAFEQNSVATKDRARALLVWIFKYKFVSWNLCPIGVCTWLPGARRENLVLSNRSVEGSLAQQDAKMVTDTSPIIKIIFRLFAGGGSTSEFQNEVQNCVMIAWYRTVPVQLFLGYFNVNKTKLGETGSPITCVHISAPKMDIDVGAAG